MNIFIEAENGNFDLSHLFDNGTTSLDPDWTPLTRYWHLIGCKGQAGIFHKIIFQDVHFHQQLLLLHKVSSLPSVTLRRLNCPNNKERVWDKKYV